MKLQNISLLGSGRMGEALIASLVKAGASKLVACDVKASRLKNIKRSYPGVKVTTSLDEAISKAKIVLLCVKPQIMKEVLKDIKGSFSRGQLVISIAAGINLSTLNRYIKKSALVRVMPNTPLLVEAGMSAIAYGPRVTPAQKKAVLQIFEAVGKVEIISEKLMDAVTGLSGSGPAFTYAYIDALAQGGRLAGLKYKTALALAIQTVLGAALMLKHTKKSPQELINMVTSPGGTTLEGLKVLKSKKVAQGIASAVTAAAKRAKELSR
ncbi:MAG: pyrroline-5-carboxylate reductase [bacterium]